MKNHNFIDKESMREIGYALWQARQEKRLYLDKVQKATNIPQRIIDGMETGRKINYGALRKLLRYYEKNMKIVLE